jgi:hypothetical protein
MADGRPAHAEQLTRALKQILGVVLISWERILRVGLVTAGVALLTTEIVSCVVTRTFPPPSPTHLVAIALAFALGYGVAVTVLFAMVLRGAITFIRHLEGEVVADARAVEAFAERVVERREHTSQPTAPAARVPEFFRPLKSPKPFSPPPPRVVVGGATAAAAAAAASVQRDVAAELLPLHTVYRDVRRDPDDAIIRAPAAAFASLPVLAAHLPRIGWANDESRLRSVTQPRPEAPPAPWQVVAELPPETSPDARVDEAETLAEAPLSADTMDEDRRGTPDIPGLIPRGHRSASDTRPLPAITRPLPAITRPLPTPSGERAGGLWARVSHALVGKPGELGAGDERHDLAESQPLFEHEILSEDAWLSG